MNGSRIVINAASHGARVLVATASVVVLTPLMISHLGLDGFGHWAICMAVLAWMLFLDMGASTTMVKHVAEARAAGNGVAERAIIAQLTRSVAPVAVVAGTLVWLQAPWLSVQFGSAVKALIDPLRATAVAAALLVPLSLCNFVLLGRHRHLLANGIAMAGRAAQFLVTLVVLLVAADVTLVVAVSLGTQVLTGVAHRVAVALSDPPPSDATATAHKPQHCSERRSFFAINFAVAINTQADTLLVGWLAGPAAAGLFRLAERVTGYLGMFLKQVSHSLIPEIAAAAKRDESTAHRQLFVYGSRWTLFLGLLPLAILATWGDWLLGQWVGEPGRNAGLLAAVIWAALLASLLQAQAVNLLALTGDHRHVARIFLLTALANVAASIALGWWLGMWGVVVATLVTVTLVDLVWLIPAGCRRADVPFRDAARQILLGPMAMAGITAALLLLARALQPEPGLSAGVGIIVASVLLYLALILGPGLDRAERAVLTTLIGRLRRQRKPQQAVPVMVPALQEKI